MKDKWIKAIDAHIVKAKGTVEVSKRIVEFFGLFRYKEIVLKLDNEPAIKVLRDDVVNTK